MGNICGQNQQDQPGGASIKGDGPVSHPLMRKKTQSIGSAMNFKALKEIESIKEDYKIGKILGQGAFGKVYRCTNIKTKQ